MTQLLRTAERRSRRARRRGSRRTAINEQRISLAGPLRIVITDDEILDDLLYPNRAAPAEGER